MNDALMARESLKIEQCTLLEIVQILILMFTSPFHELPQLVMLKRHEVSYHDTVPFYGRL